MLADGDGIGRLIALDETRRGVEDEAVVGAVEIVRRDHVCNLIPRPLIEHETAEQRLLGFYGVWRESEPLGRASGEVGGYGGFGHGCVELAARNRRPATRRPL